MLTPLISLARSMRMSAPSHPLRGRLGDAACDDGALALSEDAVRGWHESSYELMTGVEIVECDWIDAGDLGLWGDALQWVQ